MATLLLQTRCFQEMVLLIGILCVFIYFAYQIENTEVNSIQA